MLVIDMDVSERPDDVFFISDPAGVRRDGARSWATPL